MSEFEKVIAKIESTHLGYEDHGIFSLNVSFTYGSSAQGTGHYCVCSGDPHNLCPECWKLEPDAAPVASGEKQ